MFFLPSRQPRVSSHSARHLNQFAAVGKPSQSTACLLWGYFWFWIESRDLGAFGKVGKHNYKLKNLRYKLEHTLLSVQSPQWLGTAQLLCGHIRSSQTSRECGINWKEKNVADRQNPAFQHAKKQRMSVLSNTTGLQVFCFFKFLLADSQPQEKRNSLHAAEYSPRETH